MHVMQHGFKHRQLTGSVNILHDYELHIAYMLLLYIANHTGNVNICGIDDSAHM